MATFNPTPHELLAKLLRAKRLKLGISAREVARRAGLDNCTIARLERAMIPRPTVESLTAIAQVLDIPAADIFAITEWLPKGELPTFTLYMRAKYPEMPETALAEIEAYARNLATLHRISPSGPPAGEDERDE